MIVRYNVTIMIYIYNIPILRCKVIIMRYKVTMVKKKNHNFKHYILYMEYLDLYLRNAMQSKPSRPFKIL